VPYLSALEVWSWQGAIQIHVYLYLCQCLSPSYDRCYGAVKQLHQVNKILHEVMQILAEPPNITSSTFKLLRIHQKKFLPSTDSCWLGSLLLQTHETLKTMLQSAPEFAIFRKKIQKFRAPCPWRLHLCAFSVWPCGPSSICTNYVKILRTSLLIISALCSFPTTSVTIHSVFHHVKEWFPPVVPPPL